MIYKNSLEHDFLKRQLALFEDEYQKFQVVMYKNGYRMTSIDEYANGINSYRMTMEQYNSMSESEREISLFHNKGILSAHLFDYEGLFGLETCFFKATNPMVEDVIVRHLGENRLGRFREGDVNQKIQTLHLIDAVAENDEFKAIKVEEDAMYNIKDFIELCDSMSASVDTYYRSFVREAKTYNNQATTDQAIIELQNIERRQAHVHLILERIILN